VCELEEGGGGRCRGKGGLSTSFHNFLSNGEKAKILSLESF
jgi:hypothetical protein